MNIIVTGGAGFIGSNFVFHMLKKYPDYRIICLDKLTYAGNLSTLAPVMDNPNFRFVKADICDREAVNKLFEEEHPDIVVNFAAESHVDRSIEDPGIFLQTNIIGTSVLMDACRKYGIQRYHQVSTDEVYGDLPLDRPDLFFTEETPIHTSSPYSSSKAAADLLVLAYHRTYGLPVTISRCSNNYGPYHFPEKLIPLMIANALADKPLPVYGEGLNVRDWLYVEDHCKAIAMAVFDIGQSVVNSFSGIIRGNTAIDISSLTMQMQAAMATMEIGELVILTLETLVVSWCLKILSIVITVIMYGRMIEIYLYTSLAPIPFATMSNREWGHVGTNYFRGLFALAFQAFLMMVCVAIYAALIGSIRVSSDIHSALFGTMAYTVILCFSLLKTASLSKQIFGSH